MKSTSPFYWFLQKLFHELFILSLLGWLFLFFLETVKSGLVSSYLSLPHLALFVFVLGIIAIGIAPGGTLTTSSSQMTFGKKEQVFLVLFSLFAAFLLIIATQLSGFLTLLLIFVTVLSLWFGAITLIKEE